MITLTRYCRTKTDHSTCLIHEKCVCVCVCIRCGTCSLAGWRWWVCVWCLPPPAPCHWPDSARWWPGCVVRMFCCSRTSPSPTPDESCSTTPPLANSEACGGCVCMIILLYITITIIIYYYYYYYLLLLLPLLLLLL